MSASNCASCSPGRARPWSSPISTRPVCAGHAPASAPRPPKANAIHAADVDILAPCALGATLNDRTIPEIAAAVVAGGANNQLAEDRHGRSLQERGILYAPDYVINAGGIINISCELDGYDRDRALARTGRIYDTLAGIFTRADRERLPTNAIADRIAAERLAAAPAPRAASLR